MGSLEFHNADFWEIEEKFDLNRDGNPEYLIGTGGDPHSGLVERAIISPCSDSLFTLIFGPKLNHHIFPAEKKLPDNLAYYVKGIDSLSVSAGGWMPLIEITTETHGDECSDWMVERLQWKDDKYRTAARSKCDCRTGKCR